jgi:hypothetical protein
MTPSLWAILTVLGSSGIGSLVGAVARPREFSGARDHAGAPRRLCLWIESARLATGSFPTLIPRPSAAISARITANRVRKPAGAVSAMAGTWPSTHMHLRTYRALITAAARECRWPTSSATWRACGRRVVTDRRVVTQQQTMAAPHKCKPTCQRHRSTPKYFYE